MKKLFTVREAAEALSLQPSTIRAWISARKLPVVRCGRAIRIPSAAIEDYIERHTIPAKAQR